MRGGERGRTRVDDPIGRVPLWTGGQGKTGSPSRPTKTSTKGGVLASRKDQVIPGEWGEGSAAPCL